MQSLYLCGENSNLTTKMKIKEVKYSYMDKKYGLGPYIDFCVELDVTSTNYKRIVEAIQDQHPEYSDVKVMSLSK